MKIKIFRFSICFHRWIKSCDKYGIIIRKCKDCNKTQIQLLGIKNKKIKWIPW